MKIINPTELKEILKSNKIVVLDVYADWCGPCKMLAPVLEQLSKTHTDITFVKMNSEGPENIEFLKEKKVTSIPELFFYKNGVEKHRQVGFQAAELIMEKIEEIK